MRCHDTIFASQKKLKKQVVNHNQVIKTIIMARIFEAYSTSL